MTFGNAYIETALGQFFHHDIHRTARRHRWCNADDTLVLFGKFEQCLTKNVLEFWRMVRVVANDSLARFRVEFAGRVPNRCLLFGRFVAFSLRRVQVKQFRTAHILQLSKNTHQFNDVVAVERSEITDVHTLENVLLTSQSRFQRIVEANQSLPTLIAHHSTRLEPLRSLETQFVVGRIRIELQQVFLHTAHRLVNRHIVVVEDDEQVVVGRRNIVQTLERQSAAHRTVADNRDNFSSNV